jgi:hypothetical protein
MREKVASGRYWWLWAEERSSFDVVTRRGQICPLPL